MFFFFDSEYFASTMYHSSELVIRGQGRFPCDKNQKATRSITRIAFLIETPFLLAPR